MQDDLYLRSVTLLNPVVLELMLQRLKGTILDGNVIENVEDGRDLR